jgi:hypothetical protein
MKEVFILLDEARDIIGGEMDCHTPTYAAVDKLHRAVLAMAEFQRDFIDQINQMTRR